MLLNNGCILIRLKERQTALHIAARLGNVDNIVLLLQHGASPDSATHDLYTALHIAAKEGHEEVVRVLLDNGANQSVMTKVLLIKSKSDTLLLYAKGFWNLNEIVVYL